MNNEDIKRFFAKLDAVCEALGKPTRSEAAKALYLEQLASYGISNILGAISAHLNDPERGRFLPSPADLVHQVKKAIEQDGRPSADEAWALALQLQDEAATVIATQEIHEAWAVACEVMPDKTGARMAFRAAYERLCEQARSRMQKPKWFPSLGRNVEQRAAALEEATRKGLILESHSTGLLPAPAPTEQDFLMLERSANSDVARKAIAALKTLVSSSKSKNLSEKEE